MFLPLISALIAGVIFGVGLAIAGMLNPAKVTGFLDLFGSWDPSLAFVMMGAIAVNATGHFLFVKKGKPLFATDFSLPTATRIDRPLLIGSAIFGIGWGMAGLCPGPVVASLILNPQVIFVFLMVLLIGLKVGGMVRARL
jgi:uncharacterized membrane protein YedE/YeeE